MSDPSLARPANEENRGAVMRVFISVLLFAAMSLSADAGEAKKRVLLLWQSPDGHPKDAHEYQLGQKILKRELDKFAGIETALVNADDPWKDGPELLAKADGVVLFISEGAKWLNADPKRLAAFQACAKRKAGLQRSALGHGDAWTPRTSSRSSNSSAAATAGRIANISSSRPRPVIDAEKRHPIQNGLGKFKVRDEFYYHAQVCQGGLSPILKLNIDGETHPVAWAHTREDGGRSFGFTGLHFHENWQLPEYRRLVTQGVLWTLDMPIPKDGIAVK